MLITLSDSYRLPDGKPLAEVFRRLFALQRREILAAVRDGRASPINLDGWTGYFVDAVLPYYLWYVAQGWKMQHGRLSRVLPQDKSLWAGLLKARTKEEEERKQRRERLLLLGLLALWDDDVTADIKRMVRLVVAGILATTSKWVNALLARHRDAVDRGMEVSRAQLVQDIDAIMRKPDRPVLIGDTESSRAFHFGLVRVLQESKYQWRKTWVTRGDELVCPVCRPLNGVTVPIDQTFVSDPQSGSYAGMFTLLNAPPAHPGTCRCKLRVEMFVDPAQYALMTRREGARV